MQDLDDMALFAQVVDHGGFSAAARALGLQTSRVSRRIAALEARLGVRLLQRSTRRVAVTEVGQRFYPHCAALLAEAKAAQDVVDRTRSAPQGLVRLACPQGLLQNGVGAIVSRYLAAHPLVRLQVEATNRRVDVIDEGFDIALRVRNPPLEDSGLVVRPLAQSRVVMVGSPALLQRHGRPARLEDLDRLPTMGFGWAPGQGAGRHAWTFAAPDGSAITHAHAPRLTVDDFATLRQAALDGVGIVYLPRYMVQAEVESGALERVLPDFSLPDGIVHLVFASRRGLVPAVRALVDALVEGFAGVPPGC
jgi:DNA-binding transcriptional LysR family regulator